MSLKNAIGATSLTFLLASSTGFAQSSPQYDGARAPGARSYGHQGHHGMRLSLEEKAMLKLDWRQQLKSMPSDQRKDARHRLKQNWRAMNPQARQQQVAQLDVQWRKLRQSTRDAALERIQRHEQRKHESRSSEGASYDGAPGAQGQSYESGPPS